MGRPALISLALIGLVWGLYARTQSAAFLNWDDTLLVVRNPHFRGFGAEQLRWMVSTFHGGHWEPLTWLSFALDHRLHGLTAAGCHGTNVVLHGVNAALVLGLGRRLLGLSWGPAVLAAVLFAAHPLRVESVAWVSERRDVLSACFYLTTALLWTHHARGGGRWALGLSYLAFALALSAKAAGLAWPLVLLALDRWPLGRWQRLGGRRVCLEKLPYLVLAGAAAVPAVLALERFGATEIGGELGPAQRVAQVVYGLVHYPWRTLWPAGLSPLVLLDPELDPLAPRFVVAAGLVLAALVAARPLARRSPAAALALGTYGLLIAPFLGLFAHGTHLVADRYSYLACLPFAFLAAGAWSRIGTRLAAGVAAAAVTASLMAMTWVQTGVWLDSERLWTRVVEVEPDNAFAWTNRGMARRDAGRPAAARSDFDRAIELRPGYAKAHAERALLRAADDPQGALADFTRALELEPEDAETRANRGALRYALGDLSGAERDLTDALVLRPGRPDVLLRRGLVHLAAGRRAEARADLTAALAAAPVEWVHGDLARERLAEAWAGSGPP